MGGKWALPEDDAPAAVSNGHAESASASSSSASSSPRSPKHRSPRGRAPPSPCVPKRRLPQRALSERVYDAPALPPRLARPRQAHGTFLRVVMVNDVYKLDKFPMLRAAIREMRATAEDCVVTSVLAGDFLSPCTLTSLDGGVAMLSALNEASVEYVMFGNHEFDLKFSDLQRRIQEFKGTWVNSNVTEPAFVGRDGQPLPEYVILRIGERRVALTGFLLDDMTQFSPLHRPTIHDPSESLESVWKKIEEVEGPVDAFLPMTHLNIKQDRELAAFIGKHASWSARTPVLLGGHDHEVFIEQVGKSMIFKAGCDADNIGVVDLYWTADGRLCRNVHLLEAEEFEPDPAALAFVQRKMASLDQMMSIPMFELPNDGSRWSSKLVRFEQEPLVSLLLKLVKKGMDGVELVFLQGGNVRGSSDYEPGQFTYGDLMRELAFDTNMAILDLPGHVLEATIAGSRCSTQEAKPFFLHCDADAKFADGANLSHINDHALEPDRWYRVATYQFLLNGMGNLEPLTSFVREHDLCPPFENCLPIKHYVIESAMASAWRNLVADQDEATFQQSLRKLFESVDTNRDGFIEHDELAAFLQEQGKCSANQLVKFLISTLDENDDGMVELSEILALAR